MGPYENAKATDGKIRLRAVWIRSYPPREILSASTFRSSDQKGSTFEFYVLIENVGKEEIEVPSTIDSSPRSFGMPVSGVMIVPYLVKFENLIGGITLVESASAYRPVKLKPGETMRLPIFYRISEKLEPHWFFYAVDETVAKRYGWWSGALKCEAEEYLPNKSKADKGSGSKS